MSASHCPGDIVDVSCQAMVLWEIYNIILLMLLLCCSSLITASLQLLHCCHNFKRILSFSHQPASQLHIYNGKGVFPDLTDVLLLTRLL